ncbi:MAG: M17 family metallopeptidase, partial [Candidatus Obscuribacterales bacterium]
MKFETCKTSFAAIDTDVLILGIFKGEEPQKVLHELDSKIDKDLSANLKSFLDEEGFKGNGYESRSFPTFGTHLARRFLVFGLPVGGSPTETSRKFGANIARKLDLLKKATTVTVVLRTGAGSKGKKTRSKAGSDRDSQMSHLQALVEGMVMGAFDFDKYKTVSESTGPRKKKAATASKVRIAGLTLTEKDFAEAVRRGLAVGEATNFARCLVAEPPAYMTPTRLAREAESMAKQSGLTAKILDEAEIKKLGMGSFLGVARGADEPARLIVLKYSAGRSKKTVGLVGKGITFDSGGLSLKPAASMERMKYDMSGAAAVIGAMKAIAA